MLWWRLTRLFSARYVDVINPPFDGATMKNFHNYPPKVRLYLNSILAEFVKGICWGCGAALVVTLFLLVH